MSFLKKSPKRVSVTDANGRTGFFANTADGTDTTTVDVCGGGENPGNPAARGANLRLAGNEATNGNAGGATLASGNVAGATVTINAAAAAGGISAIISATGDYMDIPDAGTVPATNPAAGVNRLYFQGNVLKFRNSAGTIKTVTAV